MLNCKWWRIEGLRASSRDATSNQLDGYPFRFDHDEDVELRRLLGSHNNRRENTHVFAIENSQRTRSTRPIARNANSVPAPGAAAVRVSFVLAKGFLLSCPGG